MEESEYSLERVFEIRNDRTGECIQVGPDRDWSELIQIRLKDETVKVVERMSFTKLQARLVADAILESLR